MTYPTVFFNLAAGNQPASLLDTMFNIVGGMGAIPCTAAGTNAITLTPATNYYQPASYANSQQVIFRAAATSTGAVTVQLGSLAFVKLFMSNLVQAGAGDIVINNYYQAFYHSTLDAGNGGFLINNSTTSAATQPVQATYKNFTATNTTAGTPNSQVVATADEVVMENTVGGTVKVSSYSTTTNITVNGANGLDTGAVAANTWYAWYAIYSTTSGSAGLFSTSFTTPTMPAGYTYKARLGAFLTNAASNLHRILYKNNQAQYVVTGTVTSGLPVLVSGASGAPGVPTWTAISVSGSIPTAVATQARLTLIVSSSSAMAIVAPNASYGANASITNPPFAQISTSAAVAGATCTTFDMMLEATTVQYASSGTGANGALLAVGGWRDNT